MKLGLGLMMATIMAMAGLVASACADDESCDWEGETYEVGDVWPAGDGCNSCACDDDGEVSCTLVACEVP
jgi:hypothetical protein